MVANITVQLVDGVRIVVPDALESMTSYILREQEDWFEDEIKFVRRLIKPGQRVIDIGANYGVYTLTLAKLVGPTGQVWAFEPAASTARVLAGSIKINDFTNIKLIESAVSSTPGLAQLSLNADSEINELVRGEQPVAASETVTCVTLDGCMEDHGWKDIDFMKIDAEGEEANILRGAEQLLRSESPLIQYEIKAGNDLHLDLVHHFAKLGYRSYRLVPGLDLMVPFDARGVVDAYLLNLFCCKPDKAARLAEAGFLVEAVGNDAASQGCGIVAYEWQSSLTKFPYGELLAEWWADAMGGREDDEVEAALILYARSRDESLPKAARFAALEAAYLAFKRLCEVEPAYLRLSSLARVARDYGARAAAVKALEQLCMAIFQQGQVNAGEPFLAPGARFDAVPPQSRESIGNWIAAAAAEELERTQYYSSYYSNFSNRQRLEVIRDLGFASDEMKRRLLLMQQRCSAQACESRDAGRIAGDTTSSG